MFTRNHPAAVYRKASDLVLLDCFVFVYEELHEDFAVRVPNLSLNNCDYEGGLHPSRLPAIKAVHLIFVSHCQVIVARRLHMTPHYSVAPADVESIHSIAKGANIPVREYVRSQSYVNPAGFIRVYNYDTPEFAAIEPIFSCIPFEDTEKVVGQSKAGSRGNRQVCVGFSTQDLNHRDESSVVIPGVNKDTRKALPSLVALSALAKHLDVFPIPPSAENEDRQNRFARSIHPENILEGATIAINDEKSSLTLCHPDSSNCQQPGFDGSIIVSRLGMVQDSASEGDILWVPQRVVKIGYMRKPCADYQARCYTFGSLVDRAKEFYFKELPEDRRGISRESFFSSPFEEVIEGGGLSRLCNMDKLVFYAAFADPFRKLIDKYRLSLCDISDLAVVIPWVTEASKFNQILAGWMEVGLPEGSLAVAFGEEAVRKFGCFSSGPANRMGVSMNKPIPFDTVRSSQKNILKAVLAINEETVSIGYKAASVAHRKLVRLLSLSPRLGGVEGCAELGAHHLVAVLVMIGAIHHPVLLTHSKVSTATNTAKRVKDLYGVPTAKFPQLLNSIAHALGVEIHVAENILCEMTRTSQKNDIYFPGKHSLIGVLLYFYLYHLPLTTLFFYLHRTMDV